MGFMDKAKQMAEEAAATARTKAGELEKKAKPTIQKTEQELDKLDEKFQPFFDQVVQDGKDLAAKAKEKLK